METNELDQISQIIMRALTHGNPGPYQAKAFMSALNSIACEALRRLQSGVEVEVDEDDQTSTKSVVEDHVDKFQSTNDYLDISDEDTIESLPINLVSGLSKVAALKALPENATAKPVPAKDGYIDFVSYVRMLAGDVSKESLSRIRALTTRLYKASTGREPLKLPDPTYRYRRRSFWLVDDREARIAIKSAITKCNFVALDGD